MIDRLHIQNFKTWKDTTQLTLAPITLFFGGNSSGKSSIGQLLMLLKQTAQSQDRSLALLAGTDHTPVDLGTFVDLIHNQDITKPLEVSLRLRLSEQIRLFDVNRRQHYSGDILGFATKVQAVSEHNLAQCSMFEYKLGSLKKRPNLPKKLTFTPEVTAKLAQKEGKPDEYTLETTGFKAVRNQGRGWPLGKPYHFYGFPDGFPPITRMLRISQGSRSRFRLRWEVSHTLARFGSFLIGNTPGPGNPHQMWAQTGGSGWLLISGQPSGNCCHLLANGNYHSLQWLLLG